MAQPFRLLFVPIKRGLDVRFGQRPNDERRHLLGPTDNPGADLWPRRSGSRMGLEVGQALVNQRLVRRAHREALAVSIGSDAIPNILNELQAFSDGQLTIVEGGLRGHAQ